MEIYIFKNTEQFRPLFINYGSVTTTKHNKESRGKEVKEEDAGRKEKKNLNNLRLAISFLYYIKLSGL